MLSLLFGSLLIWNIFAFCSILWKRSGQKKQNSYLIDLRLLIALILKTCISSLNRGRLAMSQTYSRRLTVFPSYFLISPSLLFASKCKQSLLPCFHPEPLPLDKCHVHGDGSLQIFCSPSSLCVCQLPMHVQTPVGTVSHQQGFLGGLLRMGYSLLESALLTSSTGFSSWGPPSLGGTCSACGSSAGSLSTITLHFL